MIVNINNSTYEMNSKQYKAVLDTASKAVTVVYTPLRRTR